MRHEHFYRDLFVNVLATGVVAIIGYIYAIGAGYVRSPSGSQTLHGVWHVIVGLTIAASVLWVFFFVPFRDPDGYAHCRRPVLWAWRAAWVLVIVFDVYLALHYFSGMFDEWWPFTKPDWQ
ncbi:hypothetical protein [Mycobacterium sp. E3198]|uniref:hypothetical protein n=1 Tax=Mycobacterium sp. E3198 TaxID=1834143 RepID=UPI0007FEBF3A|nr:hypothetical protein [Mycobacterium sp. E3198]OBG25421.1 hypothetical protein A5673_09040 [Mycobacterium sp. E3198]